MDGHQSLAARTGGGVGLRRPHAHAGHLLNECNVVSKGRDQQLEAALVALMKIIQSVKSN